MSPEPAWSGAGLSVAAGGLVIRGAISIGLKRPQSGFFHNAHHNFGSRKSPAWRKYFQIQTKNGAIRKPYGKRFQYKRGD